MDTWTTFRLPRFKSPSSNVLRIYVYYKLFIENQSLLNNSSRLSRVNKIRNIKCFLMITDLQNGNSLVVQEFDFRTCSIREYRCTRSFWISYTEYHSVERILQNETRRGKDRFVRSTFNEQRRLLRRTKKLGRRFGMNYGMQRDWPAARNNRIRDNCESFPERRMVAVFKFREKRF